MQTGSPLLELYVKELLVDLDNRLGFVDKDPFFVAAMFLDPKYRLDFFDAAQSEAAKGLLKSLITETEQKKVCDLQMIAVEDEFAVLRKTKGAPLVQNQRSPSSEIENYMCEERVLPGHKVNPLEYWKLKESQGDLRGLCKLAKRVFCATPTTAAIERVFSIAGFIISNRRTLLSDELFESLLFNHLNGDLRSFSVRVSEMVNGRKRKFISCEQ